MTEKVLTEKQQKFLDVLFEEAEGDLHVAKRLAGYSDNSSLSEIMPGLREAIIEKSKDYLAYNAAAASHGIRHVLKNPSQAGASIKIKAAESILNRVGITSKENTEVELKVPKGGLIILPAKESSDEKPEQS